MASLLSGAGEEDVSSMVPSEMQTSPHPSLTSTSTPTLIETSCLLCRQGLHYSLELPQSEESDQIPHKASANLPKTLPSCRTPDGEEAIRRGDTDIECFMHSFCIGFRQQIRLVFSEVADVEDGFDRSHAWAMPSPFSCTSDLETIGP
jgi:hypothetical protein